MKRVTEGLDGDLKFNTGIAALMELVNAMYALEPKDEPERAAVREALVALATLLAPFAPHVAEELWHEVLGPRGAGPLLAEEPWPTFDPALVAADTVTIAVQVNGKLRGEVQAPAAAGEAEVRALAEAEERVQALPRRQDREEGGLRPAAAAQLRGGGLARAPRAPPPRASSRARPRPLAARRLAAATAFSTALRGAREGRSGSTSAPFENRSTEPELGAALTAALRERARPPRRRRSVRTRARAAVLEGEVAGDRAGVPSSPGGGTWRLAVEVRGAAARRGRRAPRSDSCAARWTSSGAGIRSRARGGARSRCAALADEAAADVLRAFER